MGWVIGTATVVWAVFDPVMADVGKRKTREQKREKERERERNKRDQVVVFGAFTTDDSQAGIAVNCPFTKNVPKGVGDGEIWSLKDFALWKIGQDGQLISDQ